jgi:hypothetical protein
VKEELQYRALERKHPELAKLNGSRKAGVQYTMVVATAEGTRLFKTYRKSGHLVMALNSDHPFFKKVYAPLCDDIDPRRKMMRQQLELLLFAAARAEVSVGKNSEKFLGYWSDIVATFLQ